MYQFLMDISVNMYEVIAMFAIMLASFRFSLIGNLKYAFIAAIVMAQTSYLLRFVFNEDSITPLFMLLWFIIFLWLLFRIHPFYALLMTVTGYLSYLIVQSFILLVLQLSLDMQDIVSSFLNAKLIQIAGSTVTLGIAYWLLQRRIGFSFVPDRSDIKVDFSGLNLILLAVSLVACLFITGGVYLFVNLNFLYSTLSIICLLCVISILLILKFAFKKEMIS
ncbi:hypothetical protein [Cohnella abietis]|uniref:Uncharacterized protein n=1 Tax=Cohnella abietis TaxID=2507935 RepID=A0A3T1D0W8_9BACL|nr:hypothetical protein [Cohnella abietis]BBI31753.1 hypothetical protein KCTCHS21_11520 [Cohnella abietis]